MKDFFDYDVMMARYYKNMSGNILPLVSWEFYGEHHIVLESFKEDFNTLKKITKNWNFKRDYYQEFIQEQSVIVITNPNLKIVYASQNIQKLSGYSPNEVIGNSPKIFQGKDTCVKTSAKIRSAIENEAPFEVSILNYKKDETPYVCVIKGFPVRDKYGELVNYIAFEKAA
ncbi:PAS domain S-box-containing protein [Aquimarina sp. MAR_2010_214]|uniref:PAS domain-containing protein n=1 Tax=Aquimarina sp. MAR_2010_214 TaxID=1250026 RepID=UPI000C707738|nr:PAS domain-containing protein [Aquimarina sp. MAR_2010_214]PKV50014.1 PAS domain S-box-containing protein [Aquimarina sp. MAR_2010_214]